MTPQIIAHRGASYLAPENTLTAFKKAMEIGADGVEMDVQQTIDAGLVIHHDYMIDLHTDISGKIYDMTMGDLKELDFGSWKDAIYQDEKIATLQEAMELCKQMPGCTVHLELKSTMNNDPDFVPRVLEVLRQTEIVDQVILVSFNHALLRQAKQLLPELRVGALVYGELESMLLPPPIIWKDLGLTNGIDDMEAMDAALPESAADEENCSWMTRWMSDKVSMLRANFPGESLNEIYKNLLSQRDLPAYIRSLDFVPEWVSCEYHTAYKNAGFIDKLHEMGIKVSLWTVDTEDSVRSLLRTSADAYITNRPDRVREWMEKEQAATAHKGQLCGDGALAVHPCRSLAYAHSAVLLHQFTVEGEHVPGGDLLAEAGTLDAAEQCQLALVFRQAQRCHSAGLCQCFQQQHAGHDRLRREVAVEKLLVAGDALAADGPLPRLVVQNAVHEGKGVAVG